MQLTAALRSTLSPGERREEDPRRGLGVEA
jgi:hypothetical protein